MHRLLTTRISGTVKRQCTVGNQIPKPHVNSKEQKEQELSSDKIFLFYVPFVPRPTVTINDDFMKPLTILDQDTPLMVQHKTELTKYFKARFGNKYCTDTDEHLLYGSFVRCISVAFILSSFTPQLGTIYMIFYYLYYSEKFDEDEYPIKQLAQYNNLYK